MMSKIKHRTNKWSTDVMRLWPTPIGGMLLWVPPLSTFIMLTLLSFIFTERSILYNISIFWTIIGTGSLIFTDVVRRRTRERWRAACKHLGGMSVAALVALSIHRFTMMIEFFHAISIGVGVSTLIFAADSTYRILLARNALVMGQVILFMLAFSILIGDEIVKRKMKGDD